MTLTYRSTVRRNLSNCQTIYGSRWMINWRYQTLSQCFYEYPPRSLILKLNQQNNERFYLTRDVSTERRWWWGPKSMKKTMDRALVLLLHTPMIKDREFQVQLRFDVLVSYASLRKSCVRGTRGRGTRTYRVIVHVLDCQSPGFAPSVTEIIVQSIRVHRPPPKVPEITV